jgi:copper chaperone CopZ
MSTERTLRVSGMSCTDCEANVGDTLEGIDGVDGLEA